MLRIARSRFMCLALTLCGVGACSTQEVPLGDAVLKISLDQCFGDSTSCQASKVEPRVMEAPDELTCELDAALERSVGWTVTSHFEVALGVVAPDDALWVGSETQGFPPDPPSEVVIQRFDADGELTWMLEPTLSSTDHDFWTLSVTSISFDARGHGFVVIEGWVADRVDGWATTPAAWLLEIDPEGEMIGDPIAIEGAGAIKVVSAADGSLLLSAKSYVDMRSVIGRLNADRTVAWIQTALRQLQIYQLVSDDDGGAVVYGTSAAQEIFDWDDSIALYDASGNLLWDVHPRTEIGNLARAPGGNVIGVGKPEYSLDQDHDRVVFNLRLDGETEWSVRLTDTAAIEDSSVWQPAVDDAGNVYLSGRDSDAGPVTLYKIDADGEHCTKAHMTAIASIAVSGGDTIANLIFAPSGKTYFRLPSGVSGGPTTFGVLEP